jgi:hypothetical protein
MGNWPLTNRHKMNDKTEERGKKLNFESTPPAFVHVMTMMSLKRVVTEVASKKANIS